LEEESAEPMLRLFIGAERAWSVVPGYVKVVAALFALIALALANTTSVVAAPDADPFRWR
jgi:hypothetical protein